MAIYKAPLEDMRFLMNELFDVNGHLAKLPNELELESETVMAVLEEAGKLAENVFFPLNQVGDEIGCRFDNGTVTTPKGFKEAFKTYCEGGWMGIGGHTAYGGQDLPKMVQVLIEEMMYASNSSLYLYASLSNGAYQALYNHGEEKYKNIVLPKLMSGEWAGTMCLTESHAGTDLGLMKTKAIPQDDGSYKISGSKIFITGGEHDLSDNIVHLVLAKLPDAPPGSKGISLFLVPKFHFDDDGNLGERNGIACGAIEKKMGIKGSATCVMNMDDATGYIIGGPHQGLRAMFTMMNTERLSIGLQGLGSSEVAYQSAVEYAKDRVQGRGNKRERGVTSDPIIVHPDIRRMLLTMRAYNEAIRAFAVWTGIGIDLEKHGSDEEKSEAAAIVALTTPIAKAFFSDMGFDLSNLGLQVFGGHGYIVEWGMEQLVRDCRIAQIYEGTNGVQALDLVGRKLAANNGAFVELYLREVRSFIDSNELEALKPYWQQLQENCTLLEETSQWLLDAAKSDLDQLGAASVDYLHLFGLNICAYMWARALLAVEKAANPANKEFYEAKKLVGDFFFKKILPDAAMRAERIKAGSDCLMQMDAELF